MRLLIILISEYQNFSLYPFSFTAIFDIVLQFVCSYYLLNVHFYKLQFFSLFLNFGIFIIILVIDLCNFFLHESFEPHLFLLRSLHLLFYCLEYIYGKKVILYGYISIYLFMIIKGFIKLILFILLTIILLIVKKEYLEVIPFLLTHTKYIILIIVYIILYFFLSLFLWMIIDRFSPNHTPLILILEELVNFINSIINTSKPTLKEEYKIMGWDLYVRIFLYVISFIGVLIHNELIIINFCGLGSDTKYILDLEFKNEEDYINANNPEDLKKFGTLSETDERSNENENMINN